MDTPLPAQIRPAQPEATHASEAEEMELMEMILGALGRDALGMGSSIAHPRESEGWKAMSQLQKLEFFAPIWRIMRDENMTVDQVCSPCFEQCPPHPPTLPPPTKPCLAAGTSLV